VDLGFATEVVPDQTLLTRATGTAQRLAEKSADALRACKRLLKRSSREQLLQAVKVENEEFSAQLSSADTKEAITAFFEKRPPNFTRVKRRTVTEQSQAL
jgi:enoyl-CoA hydratase/carnithine racemase